MARLVIDNLVLIASPINDSLFQAVKNHANIKKVIVVNLTQHGDPIYVGMTDMEILQDVFSLKEQMDKGNGHFYYSVESEEGKKRRRKLVKKIFYEGLR